MGESFDKKRQQLLNMGKRLVNAAFRIVRELWINWKEKTLMSQGFRGMEMGRNK